MVTEHVTPAFLPKLQPEHAGGPDGAARGETRRGAWNCIGTCKPDASGTRSPRRAPKAAALHTPHSAHTPRRLRGPDGTVLATRRDPRCSPASASSVPSPWEGDSDPHGAREHAGAGRRARCRQCGLTVHVCRPKGSRRWVTTGTSRGSFHTNSRGAASLNPAMECFTEHTCGTSEP